MCAARVSAAMPTFNPPSSESDSTALVLALSVAAHVRVGVIVTSSSVEALSKLELTFELESWVAVTPRGVVEGGGVDGEGSLPWIFMCLRREEGWV